MDKMNSKIIQISASSLNENNATYLYALCADGSVWYRFTGMPIGDWHIVSTEGGNTMVKEVKGFKAYDGEIFPSKDKAEMHEVMLDCLAIIEGILKIYNLNTHVEPISPTDSQVAAFYYLLRGQEKPFDSMKRLTKHIDARPYAMRINTDG